MQRSHGHEGATGIDRRFPRRVGAVALIAALVLVYPLLRYASPPVAIAVAAGAVMSTVNALLGFLAIEYAFGKSYTTFLKVVIGGMGVRMLGMLGIMLALILGFRVPPLPLTLSMLAFYLIYLVLEILFIQTKVMARSRD